MYAEDILLFKPINSAEDYTNLQEDIDALNECVSTCHLTMNSLKCKYLVISRKWQPHLLPLGRMYLGDCTLEQVYSYRYLGIFNS